MAPNNENDSNYAHPQTRGVQFECVRYVAQSAFLMFIWSASADRSFLTHAQVLRKTNTIDPWLFAVDKKSSSD